MDERTDPGAAFALRLSVDLLTTLVISDVISRKAAQALIDDSLQSLLQSHPEYEQSLRELAAVATSQVQLVSMDADRLMKRED